jgi:serine/threonine-protein kinase
MTVLGMPKIGDVIADKYRLDKVAGEGGMGIVYAAEHLVLKQRVAVKVLLPDAASSEAIVERFAREARAAAKINSEHVARVLDAGSLSSGSPFLVMEYLDGCDLEELLELQKTLPAREVVEYIIQALEGLAHAHAAKLVHRDLKPANLFLSTRPDGSNAIKLLDFGISKVTNGKPEDKRLTGRHVLGSPVYMSPEQLRNATDIDGRADVWSMGIVAYELLTGEPPFDGDGVGEIFAAILEKEPIHPTDVNAKVPRDLGDVVLRCLRRDPAERWDDAGRLARALLPYADDQEALVERAEQVLARAKNLTVQKTPVEARRVVAAIDAAANRAIVTATRAGSNPPLPLVKKSEKAARKATLAKPMVTASVGAALVLILGLSAYGAIHATRPSVAAPHIAQNAPPEKKEAPTPRPATTNEGADTAEADPPLVMDLPSSAPARAAVNHARGSKSPSKPQRPKFLTTSE